MEKLFDIKSVLAPPVQDKRKRFFGRAATAAETPAMPEDERLRWVALHKELVETLKAQIAALKANPPERTTAPAAARPTTVMVPGVSREQLARNTRLEDLG